MAESSSASSPTSSPSSSRPLDDSYYTWANFFSILTGTASRETTNAYYETRDTLHEASDCARCETQTRWLFKHSPTVRFLSQQISLLGPPGEVSSSEEEGGGTRTPRNPTQLSPDHNIRCRRCTTQQSGGFDPDHGILLCANKLRNRGHVEDTLAHEMVHAYDHMRFKLDPYDLRHAACMEIRAATLSGECRWTREFFTRGQWGVTQQLQECVRRRAALSVAARPACGGDDVKAARAVNEVWDSCFNDTRPFDEIYR